MKGMFEKPEDTPLAERLKPRSLDEVVGQDHIAGPDRPLRFALAAGKLPSLILYGPPGTGKTSIAKAIATQTDAEFLYLNAVTSGVAEIRDAIKKAEGNRRAGRKTLLFIDEIHRFNKAQQDALLPSVESGVITLIGATIENPFFDVISPLLSRSLIFQLKPLEPAHLKQILQRALTDKERGLGGLDVALAPDAEAHLIALSGGDARRLLNVLETAVAARGAPAPSSHVGAELDSARKSKRDDVKSSPSQAVLITLSEIEAVSQQAKVRYDRLGDMHYDVISAFIKSVRGSDPDAAIYWLALMLTAGEDPRFIARRLVILASEDVGLADRSALPIAMAAAHAVEFIGLPECQLNLAHATLYLATAPKSNSATTAIYKATAEIKEGEILEVPDHLKDSNYPGAKKLGHGTGYKYAHDYPEHYVDQQYLPKDKKYYTPSQSGYEAKIAAFLAHLASLREPK